MNDPDGRCGSQPFDPRAQRVRELCRRHELAVREARTLEAMGFRGRALPFKREAVELVQEIRALVPEAFGEQLKAPAA